MVNKKSNILYFQLVFYKSYKGFQVHLYLCQTYTIKEGATIIYYIGKNILRDFNKKHELSK